MAVFAEITYAGKKIAGRPEKHRRQQQRNANRMPQFLVPLPLALGPHADLARGRPNGAVEKVIFAQILALGGNVAGAGTERRSGRRLHALLAPGNHGRAVSLVAAKEGPQIKAGVRSREYTGSRL